MAEKKYVIRHKDVPAQSVLQTYPNSQGEWYYCSVSMSESSGKWCHKSELNGLITRPLDKISERYNRITTSIYKENILEIVELTDQLSEDLMFAKLAG